MKVLLDFAQTFKPNVVINGGDFIDGTYISTYPTDLKEYDTLTEFEVGGDLLDKLQDSSRIAPGAKFIQLEGNHEQRFRRPSLVPQHLRRLLDPKKLLQVKKRGIKWLPYSRQPQNVFRLGKLGFIHSFGHSKYVAATNAQKFGHVAFWHTHRMQVIAHPYYEEPWFGWNLGTLAKLDMSYAETWDPGAWCNGFGFGRVYRSGNYELYPVRLTNKQVHIMGKEYEVA